VKLSELRTATQIHKEDMRNWSYRWRYCLGWSRNQVEILWLKYKPKGRWVPVDKDE
jgi:hypothetical protein